MNDFWMNIHLTNRLMGCPKWRYVFPVQDEVERGTEPATNEVGIDIGVEATQTSQTSHTGHAGKTSHTGQTIGESAESAGGRRRGGASQTSVGTAAAENEASQSSVDLEVRVN